MFIHKYLLENLAWLTRVTWGNVTRRFWNLGFNDWEIVIIPLSLSLSGCVCVCACLFTGHPYVTPRPLLTGLARLGPALSAAITSDLPKWPAPNRSVLLMTRLSCGCGHREAARFWPPLSAARFAAASYKRQVRPATGVWHDYGSGLGFGTETVDYGLRNFLIESVLFDPLGIKG